jgi:hypothetical protein
LWVGWGCGGRGRRLFRVPRRRDLLAVSWMGGATIVGRYVHRGRCVCRGGRCDSVASEADIDSGTLRGVVCFGVVGGERGFFPVVGGYLLFWGLGVGMLITLGRARAHTVEVIFSPGVCHFGVVILVRG